MVEAYLRANKMFVDYNEVSIIGTTISDIKGNICLIQICSFRLKQKEFTHRT